MKKILKIAVLAVAILGLLQMAPSARAEGSPQSFQATNILASGVVLVQDPTNASGIKTGSAIGVQNYDRLGFYFSGYVTTAGTATVALVRSPLNASPSITGLARDFESVSYKTFSIPMPSTGPFMFVTNLESDFVRPAGWLGLNLITNNVGVITNLDVGVGKKLIPIGSR